MAVLKPTSRMSSQPSARESLATIEISPDDVDVELLPLSSHSVPRLILTGGRPRPSRLRRVFARLLFATLMTALLLLVACELSVVFHIPWLDPRPILMKWITFAMQKLQHLL